MTYPNKEIISGMLKTRYMGKNIVCRDTVDSTNNLAKELGAAGAKSGTLVICREQTKGRGRRGRSFISCDGTLCMSVIYRPDTATALYPRYSLATPVAVARALCTLGVNALIKWPNDIQSGGKKLCGILHEGVFMPNGESFIVCGIGVNVGELADDEEVRKIATSVLLETGRHEKREEVAALILNELEACYDMCSTDRTHNMLMEEYKKLSSVLGKTVVIKADTDIMGRVLDFDPLGRIIIETDDGTLAFNSGDVSLRC